MQRGIAELDIKNGSLAAPDRASGDSAAARASSSLSFDYFMVLLNTWLIGGLYLDGWAHVHRRIETFYTPWHLILYSGFLAAFVGLVATCLRNRYAGHAWRNAVPHGYGTSLAGAAIFIGGGVGDLFWHSFFGFERGVEALVSPSHLILALGTAMLVTGPVRATLRRAPATHLVQQIPLILSWSFLLALFQFFTQYAHPIVNTWMVTEPSPQDPRRDLVIIPVEGAGDYRIIPGRDVDFGQPRWSPDGRQIAYVAGQLADQKSWEIYVMDADGSHRQRLTNNAVYDGHPSWAPDGKTLVFESHQRGSAAIYRVHTDGSDPWRLTQASYPEANPSLSPDGKMLLFDSERDGLRQVYLMHIDGSGLQKLTTEGQNRAPSWSPDGKQIAFSSDRDGPFHIYVMAVDGHFQKRISTGNNQDEFPAWSPDGQRIAFISQLGNTYDVMLINPSGGQPINVTHDSGHEDSSDSPVSWSKDGRYLLFGTLGHARATMASRQALGLVGVLIQTALYMGFIFQALHWQVRRGGLAILITLCLGLAATQGRILHVPLMAVALGTGLAAEILRSYLCPTLQNTTGLRWFAFSLPCIWFVLYFLVLGTMATVAWSVPFWSGVVLLAGTVGWLQSFLIKEPRT